MSAVEFHQITLKAIDAKFEPIFKALLDQCREEAKKGQWSKEFTEAVEPPVIKMFENLGFQVRQSTPDRPNCFACHAHGTCEAHSHCVKTLISWKEIRPSTFPAQPFTFPSQPSTFPSQPFTFSSHPAPSALNASPFSFPKPATLNTSPSPFQPLFPNTSQSLFSTTAQSLFSNTSAFPSLVPGATQQNRFH